MDAADLPTDIAQELGAFVDAARNALGEDLVSAVLFGSAAEGRLRATSDVNLILVLARFTPQRVDALREPLRHAHATIALEVMVILEGEIEAAAEAFAVKFADIAGRHRVLYGRIPVEALKPSRGSMVTRLRQILLNFILRTRERYLLGSLRDEQMASVVADAAGPLRSAAEIILQLEGRACASPKEALETVARELHPNAWTAALADLSRAREAGRLPPGTGGATVLKLVELAQALRARAERIGP